METVVTNLGGTHHRVKWLGRDYIVVPTTMIVPGVLAGSQGPIYYPSEVVNADPDTWNHMPIVLDHPTVDAPDGTKRHISARTPEVIEKYGMGFVFNAQGTGNLGAESWFDVERTRKVSPATLSAIEAGKPLECSTGISLATNLAAAGSTYNNREYTHVAVHIKPDHLAVLPDKVGACSVQDGCGIGVGNTSWTDQIQFEETWNAWSDAAREAALEARRNLSKATSDVKEAKSDLAKAQADLDKHNEVTAAVIAQVQKITETAVADLRAKAADKIAAIKAESEKRLQDLKAKHAARRVKLGLPPATNSSQTALERAQGVRLAVVNADTGGTPSDHLDMSPEKACKILKDGEVDGKPLTEAQRGMFGALCGELDKTGNTSTNGDTSMPLTPQQRAGIISNLTTNCDCWKFQGDKEFLEKAPDGKLLALNKAVVTHRKLEPLANLFTVNADGDGEVAGVNIKDLADFFGVTVDPAQDPAGFMKALVAELDAVRAKLTNDPEDMQDAAADESTEAPADATMVPTGNKTRNANLQKFLGTGNGKGRGGRRQQPQRRQTLNEFLTTAPPEVTALLQDSAKVVNERKMVLAQKLTANIHDPVLKQKLIANHMKKDRETLELEVQALPVGNGGTGGGGTAPDLFNFFGANGGGAQPATTSGDGGLDDDDAPHAPVWNWGEIKDEQNKKAAYQR
jgi:hypothetical protein